MPEYLDTLAAAYAEVGRYDDAVTTTRKAIALSAGSVDKELANQLRERVRSYESRQPCRDFSLGK
jgi:hypothetical protein